ncbi:MAG: SCO family protein [Deltaproteobacteria bacterium]|nr:SCO family protein [Deltaproteobacteria bacterium]
MPRVRALLAFVLLLACVSPGPAAEGLPGPGAGAEGWRKYFTDLKLVDQNGKEHRFYSDLLEGRVVILSGFYVHCTTVSPRQNLVLSQLQKALGERLGREVLLLSLTIDPKRDNAEKVRDYARAFRPREGWLFLTGKPENVDWVNYRLGQYTDDLESHPGIYLVGNLKTGLWMKAPPLATVADLVRAVDRATNDAGSPPQ